MQKKWYLCGMIAKGHMFLSIVVAVGVMLTGCSPRGVREAQEVVKQADSLRTEGVPYTDSIAMAEAYNTLGKWQYLYPTDYARACYYYGRLLRNNDNPVAAMQVFINATHTNTRDYHILGRVYANMANMCRLGDYHDDAYEMYQCSAEKFHNAGDSLLYYYALNNMAFEMAELGKKEEALDLLSIISTLAQLLDIFTPLGMKAGFKSFAIPNVIKLGIKQLTINPDDSLLKASNPANQFVIDSTIVLGKIAESMSMTATFIIGTCSHF